MICTPFFVRRKKQSDVYQVLAVECEYIEIMKRDFAKVLIFSSLGFRWKYLDDDWILCNENDREMASSQITEVDDSGIK